MLAAACSSPPATSNQPTSSPPTPSQPAIAFKASINCVETGAATSAAGAEAMTKLRRTVEAGPLYAAATATRELASCRMSQEPDSLTLEYTFRDGGWLRVTQQPRIEYMDQEVRLTSPLAEDAVAVLKRAEQAAFDQQGCGIAWQDAEKQAAEDDKSAMETVYRGDVCNCQARVRTDAAGRVVGLLLRSAC
jgi:hypothetical protein